METLLNAVTVIIILIFSVIIHENAHGLAALAMGDQTAKKAGRLSLNPLKHVDPFGSVILPLIFLFAFGMVFGYAKPVPVNPRYFRDQRKGMMLTSLAGPFSNFLMAAMGSVLLTSGLLVSIKFILGAFIFINVLLGLFNLIPIPPLDGSKVLEGVLPRAWLTGYYKFENIVERYFMIIMILIIVLRPGILSQMISSVIRPIVRLLGVDFIG